MHLSLDVLKEQREAAEKAFNEWLTRLDSLHRIPVPYEQRPALLEELRRINDLVHLPVPGPASYTVQRTERLPGQIPCPPDIPRDVYPRSLKGRIKEKIRIFATRLLQLEDRFAAVNSRIDWVYGAHRRHPEDLDAAITRVTAAVSARDADLVSAIARQNEFRTALVPFLNDFAQASHDLAVRMQELESARVRYFQTIIAMVDTKDREVNGLINNHVQNIFNHLNAGQDKLKNLIQNRVELLSGRLDVLLESFDRKLEKMMLQLHESALVRDEMHRKLEHELRRESDLLRAAISDEITRARQELFTRIGEVSNGTLSLKRQVQNLLDSAAIPVHGAAAVAAPSSLDDYKYSNFEFRYRGSEELIRERFRSYADLFDCDGPVLDAGCGRGELLELLADTKRPCYGIDINDEMVAHCREKGLRAEKADVVGHLESLGDGTLGGLFSAQVVEHLEPAYLLRFLELSFFKLKKGGRLVIETINPTSLYALFEAYYRDLSHVQPIHPDTLRFFVEESGFGEIEILSRSPVASELKLTGADDNTKKLNRILFGDQDYALVARKL
ncbi:MAG: methyltransferase domain-containing protein [Acidobacteria bacterium]|nr:methyltransferase domain-containing protein [Acidobacteriota bacterium]